MSLNTSTETDDEALRIIRSGYLSNRIRASIQNVYDAYDILHVHRRRFADMPLMEPQDTLTNESAYNEVPSIPFPELPLREPVKLTCKINKHIDIKRNNECPISYEPIKDNDTYLCCGECKYNFSEESILKYLNGSEKRVCPMCRAEWTDYCQYVNKNIKADFLKKIKTIPKKYLVPFETKMPIRQTKINIYPVIGNKPT